MNASKKQNSKIKAADFDEAFDKGDVFDHLDVKSAKIRQPLQRINIDFPKEIIKQLDHRAQKLA